jgi:hypothetical protein
VLSNHAKKAGDQYAQLFENLYRLFSRKKKGFVK